jgi:hypothetical protein
MGYATSTIPILASQEKIGRQFNSQNSNHTHTNPAKTNLEAPTKTHQLSTTKPIKLIYPPTT